MEDLLRNKVGQNVQLPAVVLDKGVFHRSVMDTIIGGVLKWYSI